MPKSKDAKPRTPTEEEQQLYERLQRGEPDAVAEFIAIAEPCLNQLLSRHKQHNRYSSEDLAQDVRLALCRESKHWDPTIASLSTFFGYCVRGRLLDAIRTSSPAGMRYRGEPPPNMPTINQLSLYDPHDDNSFTYRQNIAEPVDSTGESDAESVEMNDILHVLRESTQLNVLADYAMGETMKQVGRRYKLSESRVSQKITQIREDQGIHKRILTLLGKDH